MMLSADLLEGLAAYAAAVRPLEDLSPADWAQKHRDVKGGPFPGPWRNENAPYLVGWMNAVSECLRRGLKGVVGMKAAQGAGSEVFGINALAWLLTYFAGPYLYLTAIDRTAEEFSRDRWAHVLETCEPLKAKHLAGKAGGERILVKRFTDAKLVLSGSQSPNNYISNPFRGFCLDEYSATADQLTDGSDPLLMLLQRLAAWAEAGSTIGIVLGHPSDPDRGEGRLYYEESDQRRGHVVCPHCGQKIAPDWVKHVRPIARPGQSDSQALRDPSCYAFACPGTPSKACGAIWSESDRLRAIRNVEQLSVLSPEVLAEKKPKWIGVHFWRFFLRAGGSIELMATEYVAALDDPSKMRVFFNKVLGDVFGVDKDENPDEDAWRACTANARFTGDVAPYYRGELPEGATLLTAGTDQNSALLHFAIWAWGVLPTADGKRLRCGWLVDWGEIPRDPPEKKLEAADMRPFLEVVYKRTWKRGERSLRVRAVGHDSGWLPDGVYEFADRLAPIGVPMKGGNDDDRSRNPLLRWGKKPTKNVQGVEIKWRDPRLGMVNTHLAKSVFFRLMRSRFPEASGFERWRLHLPVDVEEDVLTHLSSERLARRGKVLKWEKDASKPNHLLDCSLEAYVLSEQYAAVQRDRTAEEIEAEAAEARSQVEKPSDHEKPEGPKPDSPPKEGGDERPRGSWKVGRR